MKSGFSIFALTKDLISNFHLLLVTAIFYCTDSESVWPCFDSRLQLNAHWLIKPLQPTVSAELNEVNVNISSDVTVKGTFYIKMSISDYHFLEVSYYVAAYRLRHFFNAHFLGNSCHEFVLQTP